jgi:hypothetical protein
MGIFTFRVRLISFSIWYNFGGTGRPGLAAKIGKENHTYSSIPCAKRQPQSFLAFASDQLLIGADV